MIFGYFFNWHFLVWKYVSFLFLLLTLSSQKQELCIWYFSAAQTSGVSPAWTTKKQTWLDAEQRRSRWEFESSFFYHWLTCFPPPLLGWALNDMEGPAAVALLLFPVQLLHRISPWLPFFHMEEEFVLHAAQHGFKPSGIFFSFSGKRRRRTKETRGRCSIHPKNANNYSLIFVQQMSQNVWSSERSIANICPK